MAFINGYCTLRDNQIIRDHEVIGNSTATNTEGFLADVYGLLGMTYPKFYKMNSLSQLGMVAAEALLRGRTLTKDYPAEEVGIVLSNATSSLDADIAYHESAKNVPSPSLFVYTLPNIVAGEISIRHQLKGETAFFVFEKFNAGFLHSYGELLLSGDLAKACLCGWLEIGYGNCDGFLYLVENQRRSLGLEHTAENLLKLYISR